VIERGKRLKAIVTNATGTDHIDMQAAAEHGVRVISLKGETEFLESISATAELTWGLLLSLTRRIPGAIQHVREGGWERERFVGRDLAGKKLGILGLGRLGRKVARYGLVFDMEVGSYDVDPSRSMDGIKRFETAEDLFAWAEVLSIHIPLNESTHHFVGQDLLKRMPKGALLLNTSRGAVLDDSALLACLEGGQLGGAALDVLEGELERGGLVNNPLIIYSRTNSTTLITPHIGGASTDSWKKTEVFTAMKLAQFLEQK
jgi:D-3-phosphoglycerate dehydrogenase